MKRTPPCVAIGLAALALLLAFGAHAADAPAGSACRGDTRKLCSDTEPGDGRLLTCLKQNEGQLSESCRTALPMLQRCSQEVRALCGEGSPRALRACLRQKAGQVSADCRAATSGR